MYKNSTFVLYMFKSFFHFIQIFFLVYVLDSACQIAIIKIIDSLKRSSSVLLNSPYQKGQTPITVILHKMKFLKKLPLSLQVKNVRIIRILMRPFQSIYASVNDCMVQIERTFYSGLQLWLHRI